MNNQLFYPFFYFFIRQYHAHKAGDFYNDGLTIEVGSKWRSAAQLRQTTWSLRMASKAILKKGTPVAVRFSVLSQRGTLLGKSQG
jgi:hypothetical protein